MFYTREERKTLRTTSITNLTGKGDLEAQRLLSSLLISVLSLVTPLCATMPPCTCRVQTRDGGYARCTQGGVVPYIPGWCISVHTRVVYSPPATRVVYMPSCYPGGGYSAVHTRVVGTLPYIPGWWSPCCTRGLYLGCATFLLFLPVSARLGGPGTGCGDSVDRS